RYRLNRMRAALAHLPNLDLLLLARRLWKRRVGSCALGSLEQSLLGVRRAVLDIPGALIPLVYNHYLYSGDAREIVRVFYHNQIDVLSMMTLLARQLAIFDAPEAAALPAQDRLSLARYYELLGMPDEAERAYHAALDGDDLPGDDARAGFEALSVLLRRAARRAEAVEQWKRWAARLPDDPAPCIEIAKHYEWHGRDLRKAQAWAVEAYGAMARMAPGPAQEQMRGEIEYRLTRLARKLEGLQ
ncbi:MAG: ribonuclease H-like domain-containing protein, partial [Anaerolineae bacterium]|nr:ribonuclease H-like domain-containing protein [Anaerolineae bacterium]